MYTTEEFWRVIERLPPWACIRALRDLPAQDRQEDYRPIGAVFDLLFPNDRELWEGGLLPESIGTTARKFLLSPNRPGERDLLELLVYPVLEHVAIRAGSRYVDIIPYWVAIPSVRDRFMDCLRDLASRGRLTGSQLSLLIRASPTAAINERLQRLASYAESEGRDASLLTMLANRESEADCIIALWFALKGQMDGGHDSRLARFLQAEEDSNAATVTGADHKDLGSPHSYWAWICRMLGRRPSAVLEDWEIYKNWLADLRHNPLLDPLWERLVWPAAPLRRKDTREEQTDEEREEALLLLLEAPPPARQVWFRRLLSAIHSCWPGKGCLAWKTVWRLSKLLGSMNKEEVRKQAIVVCLEGLLPDRPGRRVGLSEQVSSLAELAARLDEQPIVRGRLDRLAALCQANSEPVANPHD